MDHKIWDQKRKMKKRKTKKLTMIMIFNETKFEYIDLRLISFKASFLY